jgi:hypothetical protein
VSFDKQHLTQAALYWSRAKEAMVDAELALGRAHEVRNRAEANLKTAESLLDSAAILAPDRFAVEVGPGTLVTSWRNGLSQRRFELTNLLEAEPVSIEPDDDIPF